MSGELWVALREEGADLQMQARGRVPGKGRRQHRAIQRIQLDSTLRSSSRRLSICRCMPKSGKIGLDHASQIEETTQRRPCLEEARRNLAGPHTAIARAPQANANNARSLLGRRAGTLQTRNVICVCPMAGRPGTADILQCRKW